MVKTAQQMHYKEKNPKETAEYLQSVLDRLGIAVEEREIPESSIDTCSMRLSLQGTDIGSNGKGISREYMRASAYAEFFERMQNGHFNPWGWYEVQPEGFCHCPDEKMASSLEIAKQAEDQSFLRYYFSYRGWIELSAEERAENFEKLHKVEFHFGRGKDIYETRPFYSVRNNRVEYLPYYLYLTHYASNGMCAGNTVYEALVQGLSEILERHVQKKIFQEKPCFPDVPDAYIRKFPEIWDRMQKLRSIPGIRAYMKDGSFGGRYPVAVLLLVRENAGTFGVKLGCHPDFGIAMERAMTEATQGGDLKEYSVRSYLDFYNRGVDTPTNIYNSYKFGQAQYPWELFGDKPDYEFAPAKDVSHMTNRELFGEMAGKFLEAGYDILVRDVSFLGFPSYQILVPGFSEVQQETDLLAKVYNTRAYLAPYLACPERIGGKTAKLLLGILEYWADSPMENQMTMLYSIYPDMEFPAEDLRKGWAYLAAMCYVLLGDYGSAADKILSIHRIARDTGNSRTDFYRILYYYLTLRDVGKDHAEAVKCLERLFEPSLCIEIDALMAEEEAVIRKQYKSCGSLKCPKEIPDGECGTWAETRRKLFSVWKEHVPDQQALAAYFEDSRGKIR